MTFLPWLTPLWNGKRIVLNGVMLASSGHPPAEAVLVIAIDIAAGLAEWSRAKSAPEVSAGAGRLRSTTLDGEKSNCMKMRVEQRVGSCFSRRRKQRKEMWSKVLYLHT